MDSASIVQFLGHLRAKHVQVRGKWVQCSCPLAPWLHDGKDDRPSFAVRVEPDKESYFNCFVCKSGKLGQLLVELQYRKAWNLGYEIVPAWNLLEIEAAQKLNLHVKEWGAEQPDLTEYVFPEEWLAQFEPAWGVPMAREYLIRRDVSEEIATFLDIRWDRSRLTVCFPIRNGDGELVSLRGRRVMPSDIPYHVYRMMKEETPVVSWLGEHTVNWDKPVLLVESVFDVASVLRVYPNVLAPLSVGINQQRVKRIAKASEIVTMFDQGKGGDKAREIIQRYMGSAFIVHVMPSKKDPGVMTEDELRDELGPALKLLPAAIISV